MISFLLRRLSVCATAVVLSACGGEGALIGGNAHFSSVAPPLTAIEPQLAVSSQRFVFGFELLQTGQFTAYTTGQVDTRGTLLDSTLEPSRTIAEDEDSGDGANFRIVQELVPGFYEVLVQARNVQDGPYTLSIFFEARTAP